MREIKFRAWDPDKKTMYVPEWIDGKFGEPWHQIWQDDAVFPDGKNIVVMQETGLKDKNGKEIYEGDIVRFVYHRPHIETIEWLDGAAGFDPFIDPDEPDDCNSTPKPEECEVIGNIYQNLDFLPIT